MVIFMSEKKKAGAQNTESNERKVYGFRLDPNIAKMIDSHIKTADRRYRSEFIDEAIKYYCAHLDTEVNKSVLTDEMFRMIKACSKDSENRICTYFFKNVVELGVLSKMLGAALLEYTPEELKNVRQSVLDRVRKTHGIIYLEDVIEEEKKYRE